MNVGFRPRLKARPSLYDLIKNRSIDHLSAALSPTKLVDLEELPALPNSRPSTPIVEEPPKSPHTPVKMPPKKEAKNDIDGEEQYGKQFHLRMTGISANDSSPGSIYSVSGYAYTWETAWNLEN